MRRLLFEIAYQGTRYHGYQVQANAVSVAETLQDAIERVFGVREGIVGCSRTDAGVHANQYFFHMDTENRIPPEAAATALNHLLPGDIAVKGCREVGMDFHARYSVEKKEYLYQIWNHPIKDPFLSGLALHERRPIDERLLHLRSQEFVGRHDFLAFSSAGSDVSDTVRTIYACDVFREGDMVSFRIVGNGFLYHMVRLMAGTLLLTLCGKLPDGAITRILQSGQRGLAGPTAPACGLYLNRIWYPDTLLGGGRCETEKQAETSR